LSWKHAADVTAAHVVVCRTPLQSVYSKEYTFSVFFMYGFSSYLADGVVYKNIYSNVFKPFSSEQQWIKHFYHAVTFVNEILGMSHHVCKTWLW
jgi:hypothetical protein